VAEDEAKQATLRVFFGCFIGFVVHGIVDATREHGRRSLAFWALAAILAIITLCSIFSYFRPRGIAFFITNTAYFGLFILGAVAIAGSTLTRLAGVWGAVVAAVLFLMWIGIGIQRVREARRSGRSRRER
jgi:hypothetical protein